MRQTLKSVLLATAIVALGAGGALASGGGSMPSTGGAGGGSFGSSGPRYDPATEYAKAVSALKANQYRDAARAAEHVTEAVPQNPDAWRLLGAAKAGDNDWRGARRAYEKAVKLAPDELSGHAGLGLALANLKDGKAQGELDWLKAKAQSCGDSCPDAARLKAATTMVSDALSGGAPAPKPSASLSGPMLFGGPMAGEGAYVQAVGLINQKRYDEALTSLSAAEAKFGEHPDILTYEGYTWRKKGDYAKAEHFYKQALTLNPAHVGATEYYGELKVAEGDMAGAKKLLVRLDRLCAFDCAGAEELRRWIAAGHDPQQ